MKNAPGLRTSRRQLLAGGGWAVATAATVSGTAVAGASLPDLAGSASVILHDHRFALPADMQQRLSANGARIVALGDDPVRMWRTEIGTLLGQRDTRLLGVTRWPEFLLVRGLAAESRRHVRYQRVDPETGATIWLIY